MRLSITAVRRAEPEDLAFVAAVELAAEGRPGETRADVERTPTGASRARQGTLLVIGQPLVGFAHVVEHDGVHHLEALAVHPRAAGRGLGTSLLRAAYGVVLDAGAAVLTASIRASWLLERGFRPAPPPDRGHRGAGVPAQRHVRLYRHIEDSPAPTPAVSVIPVRDGEGGLEVFVQHRVGSMDFVPNAVVFPGGRVDPGDAGLGVELDLPDDLVAEHEAAWAGAHHERWGDEHLAVRTALATGVREVAEETGARIDPAALVPWDEWITPVGGPKRFDVRFFLLPVRDRGLADAMQHTTTEAHLSEWTPVSELVTGAETGSLLLVAPTRVLVEELLTLGSVDAAMRLRPRIVPVRHDLCPLPAQRGRLDGVDAHSATD